jgi:hypothetical protein
MATRVAELEVLITATQVKPNQNLTKSLEAFTILLPVVRS